MRNRRVVGMRARLLLLFLKLVLCAVGRNEETGAGGFTLRNARHVKSLEKPQSNECSTAVEFG